MSFLLDTNVVSEWTKPRPNPGLIAWLEQVDEDRVLLSVITLTELRYGIERLVPGKKRKRLEDWFQHELLLRFEGRILNVDPAVADTCGKLVALCDTQGRRMDALDAYIGATALVYNLTLVTRNNADFQQVVECLNPWS